MSRGEAGLVRTVVVSMVLGVLATMMGLALVRSFELVDLAKFIRPYRSPVEGTTLALPAAETLHDHTDPNGPRPTSRQQGDAPAKTLALVVVDGLRLDAVTPETMPATAALALSGTLVEAHHVPPTFTRPGLTTIATGAPPVLSGVNYNSRQGRVQVETLFHVAHRAGLATALMSTSNRWLVEMFGTGFDRVADYSREMLEGYVRAREAGADRDALLTIYLGWPDSAGHEYGPESQEYRDAIARVDAEVAALVASLDLERDTILLLSDHGHRLGGGHGGNELVVKQVPVILAGAGIRQGALVEAEEPRFVGGAASTAMAILGLRPPALAIDAVWSDLLEISDVQRTQVDQREADRLRRLDEKLASVGLVGELALATPHLRRPGTPRGAPPNAAIVRRVIMLGLGVLVFAVVAALALGRPWSGRALLPGLVSVAAFWCIYLVSGERATFSVVNAEEDLPGWVLRLSLMAASAQVLAALVCIPLLRGHASAALALRGQVGAASLLALLLLPLGGPICPVVVIDLSVPYVLTLSVAAAAGLLAPVLALIWRRGLGPVTVPEVTADQPAEAPVKAGV